MNSTSWRVSSGSSARSGSFSRGRTTRFSPARCAASAFARVGGRLDEEDIAADGCVREAGCDPWIGGALARVGREAARPEPGACGLLVDHDRLGLALGDLAGGLAAEVGDPALEVADAGLARVLAGHDAQDIVADL